MPVTIRLSRTLSDRLGEEAAQELVDWFNQVDAASTTTLRELNELNFARFDAKLEQRLAERFSHSDDKWSGRLAALDQKWEKRFADVAVAIEKRFADGAVAMEKQFADIRQEFKDEAAQTRILIERLDASVEHRLNVHLRWYIAGLITMVLGIIFRGGG